MNATKKLGEYNYNDTVNLGVVAPYTGTYTFEYEVMGVQSSYEAAFTDGDDLTFANGLIETGSITFRVQIPTADQDDGHYYITTSIGEVLFQYTNVESA